MGKEQIQSIDDKVFEHPSEEFAHLLSEQGYLVADKFGYDYKETGTDVIGIIKPVEYISFKLNLGFFKLAFLKTKKLFIGNLWFENNDTSADKIWQLNVFGNEYKRELSKLVTPIAKKYGVELVVQLNKKESYLANDLDYATETWRNNPLTSADPFGEAFFSDYDEETLKKWNSYVKPRNPIKIYNL